jgi:hypothetical protein
MMSFMFTTFTASPPNPNGFTNASPPAALLGMIELIDDNAEDDEAEDDVDDESGDDEGGVSSLAEDR